MPALLIDDGVAQRLRLLARIAGAAATSQSEGGGAGAGAALQRLQIQLEHPLNPPAYAGEGAFYPAGTVLPHECLLDVADWARITLDGDASGSGSGSGSRASAQAADEDAQIRRELANAGIERDGLTLDGLLHGARVAIPKKPKPVRVCVGAKCGLTACRLPHRTDPFLSSPSSPLFFLQSPDLIESLRKIDLVRQEAEYKAMIASTPSTHAGRIPGHHVSTRSTASMIAAPSPQERASEAEEWQEVRQQLGAIANVALSVAAVATAVWWAGGSADPIWVRVRRALRREIRGGGSPCSVHSLTIVALLLFSHRPENPRRHAAQYPCCRRRGCAVCPPLGQPPQDSRGQAEKKSCAVKLRVSRS